MSFLIYTEPPPPPQPWLPTLWLQLPLQEGCPAKRQLYLNILFCPSETCSCILSLHACFHTEVAVKKEKKVSLDLYSRRPCGFFFFFPPHSEDTLSTFDGSIFSMAGEPVGCGGIFSQLNLLLLRLMKLVALALWFTLTYGHFCSRGQRWLNPLHLRCSWSTLYSSSDIVPEFCKSDNLAVSVSL